MESTPKVVKRKRVRYFEIYISRVLRKVSENNGITADARQQLNNILCIIAKLVSDRVLALTEIAKKKTISEKEVMNALHITLPFELGEATSQAGQLAVERFDSLDTTKGVSRQERAGIIFPPSTVEKYLRKFGYTNVMVTSHAPIHLAAALEYLASEILENGVEVATNRKHVRITVRDLELGVRADPEMDDFFVSCGLAFLGGGVVPYIHPTLLTKRKRRVRSITVKYGSGRRPHRYRPGTVSLREIRKYQKSSDTLTLAKFPFEKSVRQIVLHEKGDSLKISKDVFTVLQHFIEQNITNLLRQANAVAIHSGRVKLLASDLTIVRMIARGSSCIPEEGESVETESDLETEECQSLPDSEEEELEQTVMLQMPAL